MTAQRPQDLGVDRSEVGGDIGDEFAATRSPADLVEEFK
jgi:hypothetical protein